MYKKRLRGVDRRTANRAVAGLFNCHARIPRSGVKKAARRSTAGRPDAGSDWRRDRLHIHRPAHGWPRSEEHTSELQSLMRISYAVYCLNKKKNSSMHLTILNLLQKILTI